MEKTNIVFIGRSLDGYIAGKNGELDWLESIPNPEHIDLGFYALMEETDAVVMGRTTFEVVLGFEGEWPYQKHAFVLSHTIQRIPENLTQKVTLLKGKPQEILGTIHHKGYHKLYIDGGRTIQDFLKADLIDELRITTVPILLGGGFPLFADLEVPLQFDHVKSTIYLNQLVQDWYRRKR